MLDKLASEIVKRGIPPLYSQDNTEDPLVYLQIELMGFSWKWFVIEAETRPDDFLFYGYVAGEACELGYFTLSEIRSSGLPPIVNCFKKPVLLSRVKQKYNW